MRDKTILRALRSMKVETGSFVCLGCGHEHNCSIHGCAILRNAADLIEAQNTQLTALQERIDRERNEPLTLDELRKMDGEPVWVTPLGFWALVISKRGERVKLICNDGETVWADKEIELVGPVYRHRPAIPGEEV